MPWNETVGLCLIVFSRVSVILLNVFPCLEWISLFMVIHFCVMLGWITEQRISSNKRKQLEWVYRFKLSCIHCFYFKYLENGSLVCRRRLWHCLILLENVALTPLFVINSHYDVFLKISAALFVILTTVVGIVVTELSGVLGKRSDANDCKSSVDASKESGFPASDSSPDEGPSSGNSDSTAAPNGLKLQDSKLLMRSDVRSSSELSTRSSNNASSSAGKRETMCSIQDLLANTSGRGPVRNSVEKVDKNNCKAETTQGAVSPSDSIGSNDSINMVGLPSVDKESVILPCQTYPQDASLEFRAPSRETTKVFPLSFALDRLTLDNGRRRPVSLLEPELKRAQMSYPKSLGLFSSFRSPTKYSDYESICSPEKANVLPVNVSESSRTKAEFRPKSLFARPLDQNATAASHDYENIPAVNVYRGSTGVRHWKPYLDIETSAHDYSTFKDRSPVQDSTLVTSRLNSQHRPYSLYEKAGSNYSISLPDLSNIFYSTLSEVNRPPPLVEPSSLEGNTAANEAPYNPPNYETIWYESNCNYNIVYNQISRLPPSTVEGQNRFNGSLNNLHKNGSTLPAKVDNPSHSLHRNNSIPSERNLNLTIAKSDSVKSATNPLGNRINAEHSVKYSTPSKRNPKLAAEPRKVNKSPLMKWISHSQNSLHEHTARALQMGRKVLYRPRIHVITPKKDGVKHDDPPGHIDPLVLKRRGQLSPKNRLILSEASALIHKSVHPATNGVVVSHSQEPEKRNSCPVSDQLPPPSDVEDGPQHSTPENNRHLPQMSILSAISSVISPPVTEAANAETPSLSLSAAPDSGALSGHFTVNVIRCGANNQKSFDMPVIDELESVPSIV